MQPNHPLETEVNTPLIDNSRRNIGRYSERRFSTSTKFILTFLGITAFTTGLVALLKANKEENDSAVCPIMTPNDVSELFQFENYKEGSTTLTQECPSEASHSPLANFTYNNFLNKKKDGWFTYFGSLLGSGYNNTVQRAKETLALVANNFTGIGKKVTTIESKDVWACLYNDPVNGLSVCESPVFMALPPNFPGNGSDESTASQQNSDTENKGDKHDVRLPEEENAENGVRYKM